MSFVDHFTGRAGSFVADKAIETFAGASQLTPSTHMIAPPPAQSMTRYAPPENATTVYDPVMADPRVIAAWNEYYAEEAECEQWRVSADEAKASANQIARQSGQAGVYVNFIGDRSVKMMLAAGVVGAFFALKS